MTGRKQISEVGRQRLLEEFGQAFGVGLEELLDRCGELPGAGGASEEDVGPLLEHLLTQVALAERGDEDHGQIHEARLATQLAQQLAPLLLGQDGGDEQIHRLASQRFAGFCLVPGQQHCVVPPVKLKGQQPSHDWMAIDNENSGH